MKRVRKECGWEDARVCHPGCFGGKSAEAIEKKGDDENAEDKSAQEYPRKGLRQFFEWARVWWDAEMRTGSVDPNTRSRVA